MGVSFSYLSGQYGEVERAINSVLVKTLRLGNGGLRSPLKSSSRDDADTGLVAADSEDCQAAIQCSVNFRGRNLEMVVSVKTSGELNEWTNVLGERKSMEPAKQLTVFSLDHPRHEAAVKLQKVYKSFRTRRKLADCAVLVQQSWWKLLDFAELKHSSVSFFDGEKHETAISRWSRARTRAAKVGKGLSKNDKAQKLALQHWLEAIDPRHRYGHNLHFYYKNWLQSQSREPFFYWLDIGEGKEVNLEKCPRSKLQQQCIKYLGPMERKAYEVVMVGGKFYYRQSSKLLDTTAEPNTKWIFVLSTLKVMYIGKKKKGSFQHSSFLAGGATSAAGRLIVDHGVLQAVWPHSGHYRPTEENFKDFISFLQNNKVDLSGVKLSLVVEDSVDYKSPTRQNSMSNLRSIPADDDSMQEVGTAEVDARLAPANTDALENETLLADSLLPSPGRLSSFSDKLANLVIPRNEIIQRPDSDHLLLKANADDNRQEYETRVNGDPIGSKPLQLRKQLSCKWTTGTGARIGFVRDHPQELQVRALEHVNLSPRSGRGGPPTGQFSSPRSPCRLYYPATPRLVSTPAPQGLSELGGGSITGLLSRATPFLCE